VSGELAKIPAIAWFSKPEEELQALEKLRNSSPIAPRYFRPHLIFNSISVAIKGLVATDFNLEAR